MEVQGKAQSFWTISQPLPLAHTRKIGLRLAAALRPCNEGRDESKNREIIIQLLCMVVAPLSPKTGTIAGRLEAKGIVQAISFFLCIWVYNIAKRMVFLSPIPELWFDSSSVLSCALVLG